MTGLSFVQDGQPEGPNDMNKFIRQPIYASEDFDRI